MATPPKKRLLTRDGVPEAPDWFARVLEALNPTLAGLVAALSKGLMRKDNMVSEVKVVELSIPSGASVDDFFPLRFQTDVAAPFAVWIGRAEVLSGDGINGGLAMSSWRMTPDGQVQVDYINGLLSNSKFRLTFLVE